MLRHSFAFVLIALNLLCGPMLRGEDPALSRENPEAHPLSESFRSRLRAESEEKVARLTKAIAAGAGTVALYSGRGDAHLFLGKFREAVADFEKMIALDPAHDAPHWRLGIAYYFAGEFKKSSRQFEKYHAFDGRDRENGIWKFLADVALEGIEKARGRMLAYKQFDREPFPSVYEMLAGRKTTSAMLQEVREKGLDGDGSVSFFANYYGGLNEELAGNRGRARELLGKALASKWGQGIENAPVYMWQVARVHYDYLASQPKSRPAR